MKVTQEEQAAAYPFGRVGAVGGGDAETLDVRIAAVDGPELLEGLPELGLRNDVAAVVEHLEEGSASEVVPVALVGALVHEAAQAPSEGVTVRRRLHYIVRLHLSRCLKCPLRGFFDRRLRVEKLKIMADGSDKGPNFGPLGLLL